MTVVRVYTTSVEWRPIPGFSGYEVSDCGQVRSQDRVVKGQHYAGQMMTAWVDGEGYVAVGIRRGRSTSQRVHRLVALAFHGEPGFAGAVARHMNDVKTDNRPENIEWGTKSDNAFDSLRNGTHRSQRAGPRTHCSRGHDLTGSNARQRSDGHIVCRSCVRVDALYRHKMKLGGDTSVFAAFLERKNMPTVRVYSKPACPACTLTKRLLTSLGVPYIEEDAADPQNLAALKELGFLAAPVVCAGVSNDDMWSGFQPDRIKALAKRLKGEKVDG